MAKKVVEDFNTLDELFEYLGVPEGTHKDFTDDMCGTVLTTFKRNLSMSPVSLETDIEKCKEIMLDSIELVELQESGVVFHEKGGCSTGGGCSGCGNH
ncbi:MAG: hypothetical protein D6B28_08540 [Gammaproteobacteria bacterium]|nr:MAG: hypothetical protein D6B28_08540 [Gammaproteobacteria bacterium]